MVLVLLLVRFFAPVTPIIAALVALYFFQPAWFGAHRRTLSAMAGRGDVSTLPGAGAALFCVRIPVGSIERLF